MLQNTDFCMADKANISVGHPCVALQSNFIQFLNTCI